MDPNNDTESKDMSSDGDDENGKAVETDTSSRYVRFAEQVATDKLKDVFRAVDTDQGFEVAWNIIHLDRFKLEKAHILEQMDIFKVVQHPNIIEFFAFWEDESKNQLVFISELFPSGTLLRYIEKSPPVRLRVIKTWCKQILTGIEYLHAGTPPLIHRNINCANIFIEEEVKIGLLGLETFEGDNGDNPTMLPNYMAPEYFTSSYSTGIDIWAFGMALIEMITKRGPYSDCSSVTEIHKKIIAREIPVQLAAIQDEEVTEFIKLCFLNDDIRPTATELLKHSFFEDKGHKDSVSVTIDESALVIKGEDCSAVELCSDEVSSKKNSLDQIENVNVSVMAIKSNDAVHISLQIQTAHETSEINFDYNLETDVADTVATDMCAELGLEGSDKIREVLQDQVEMFGQSAPQSDAEQVMEDIEPCSPPDDEFDSEVDIAEAPFPVPSVFTKPTRTEHGELRHSQSLIGFSPLPPTIVHYSTPDVPRKKSIHQIIPIGVDKEHPLFEKNGVDLHSLVEVNHSASKMFISPAHVLPAHEDFRHYEDLLDDSPFHSEQEEEEEEGEEGEEDQVHAKLRGERETSLRNLQQRHIQEENELRERQKKEFQELYQKIQQKEFAENWTELQHSTSSDMMTDFLLGPDAN